MNDLLTRVRGFIQGLAPRERLLLGAATGISALGLVILLVVQPILGAVEGARERVAAAERELALARRWRGQLDEVRAQLSGVEARIQGSPAQNLRSILDQLRAQSGIPQFESIDDRPGRMHEGFREAQMEIVIKGATLAQVVAYLEALQRQPSVLSVKRLRLATRSDAPELLDLRMIVSSFSPA